ADHSVSHSFPTRRSSDLGPMLEVRAYSKSFGPVAALTEANLEVHPGEVVALVGDNGAGKSTLIKAITGVQPADSGELRFDGVPRSEEHTSELQSRSDLVC